MDNLLVNKYLFINFQYKKNERLNSLALFEQDKKIELFSNNINAENKIKEIKIDWDNLSSAEKKNYHEIKIRNNKFLEDSEKIKRMNGISYFKKFVFKNNENENSIAESSQKWKKLKSEMKENLRKKANIINLKNERLFAIQNLINGDKPKRNKNAENLFKVEIKKNGKGEEITKTWEELNEEEKNYYKQKFHRLNISFIFAKK